MPESEGQDLAKQILKLQEKVDRLEARIEVREDEEGDLEAEVEHLRGALQEIAEEVFPAPHNYIKHLRKLRRIAKTALNGGGDQP